MTKPDLTRAMVAGLTAGALMLGFAQNAFATDQATMDKACADLWGKGYVYSPGCCCVKRMIRKPLPDSIRRELAREAQRGGRDTIQPATRR